MQEEHHCMCLQCSFCVLGVLVMNIGVANATNSITLHMQMKYFKFH
jgi:hypothetical protein